MDITTHFIHCEPPRKPQAFANDAFLCRICSRQTLDTSVPEYRLELRVCESDECMDKRVAQLIADELDKAQYEDALVAISKTIAAGDLRSLQVQLKSVVMAASHALRAAEERKG